MTSIDTFVLPANSFGSDGSPIGTDFNGATVIVAANGFWMNPSEYPSDAIVEVDYYIVPDDDGDFPTGYGEYDVALGTPDGNLESSFQDSSGIWTPSGNPVRFRFEISDFGESPTAGFMLFMHRAATPANFTGIGPVTVTISS
jgi:hypothetical protein